jgi:hypothetical protein
MDYRPFPALLTSAFGQTRLYGTGKLSPAGNAVDFSADFIPLFPLGTGAAVSWIYGKTAVAEYAGQTYLSTPGKVRLVGVNPALLAPTRDIFAANTSLPGHISPAGPNAEPRDTTLAVTISYLSPGGIRLLSSQPAGEGAALWLNAEVDFLTLRRLLLTVRRQVALRRGEIILVCDVPHSTDENLIALTAYSARLEQLP